MFLLVFIGYVFVYAVLFMALIAVTLGMVISYGIYVFTYVAGSVYARIRNRKTPEWSFDKSIRRPEISSEDIRQLALFTGMMSMIAMVLGFFAHALSNGSWSVTGTVLGIVAAIGVYSWFEGGKQHTPQN
jgi:hypothetical protein